MSVGFDLAIKDLNNNMSVRSYLHRMLSYSISCTFLQNVHSLVLYMNFVPPKANRYLKRDKAQEIDRLAEIYTERWIFLFL